MGKAIYTPKGAANEYGQSATNFYKGCSGGCDYCYLKQMPLKKTLGGDTPELKLAFTDEDNAMTHLIRDTCRNLEQLQKTGVFFTFISDAMLPETWPLFNRALHYLIEKEVPVIILTKQVRFIPELLAHQKMAHRIAVGFTLTGHDELEKGCAPNLQRVNAMAELYEAGFKTWASLEPVISLKGTMNMMRTAAPFCHHFKLGLASKYPTQMDKTNTPLLVHLAIETATKHGRSLYLKDSIFKKTPYKREALQAKCLVDNSFNPFV